MRPFTGCRRDGSSSLTNPTLRLITVSRLQYRKNEMLQRRSLSLIWNLQYLNHEIIAYKLLCGIETDADSASEELRRKVSVLLSHEVVLINPLPKGDIGDAGANCLILLSGIKNPVDPWLLRQISSTPLIELYGTRL
jgi:hypothetical protein